MSEKTSRMSEVGKSLEGQIVDGKFPLLGYLGGSGHSIAFLSERKTDPRKIVIKLAPSDSSNADAQIPRWDAAAKLSHPNLIRLFETGYCQLNNQTYFYVVMEYAEENLYQILPDRPLSGEEAREMLPPVLQALRYLHGQGFVHGHIKPSNIMASGDQVKISSDGVVRMGQVGEAAIAPSLYTPPEAASVGLSPAGDVWSLGVTLVEALTQHPPFREGATDQSLPQSLSAPFDEIVRNCLRPRPEQRWFVDQIAAYLKSTAPAPAPSVVPEPVASKPAAVPPKQPTFAKPARLLAASLLAVILFVLIAMKLWHHEPQGREPSTGSAPATASQPSAANPSSEPAPATPTNPPPPTPAPPAAAAPEPATPKTSGVVQKVLPEVSRTASRTIQGTIRVKVKVTVDSSGNVSSATVISPGPSAYFARLALQSSRGWKFAPGDDGNASKPWILKFEFRQSGTNAAASLADSRSAD